MYTVVVKGSRQATLAVHRLDSSADVRELLAIYEALGYPETALIIQRDEQDQAA